VRSICAGPPFEDDLDPRFASGFSYSDCRVDDARLVVVNALSAQTLGAKILPRTACVGLTATGNAWRADLEAGDGQRAFLSAKVIVNAAGPWVEQLLREIAGLHGQARVRLVRGSHIVVPRRIASDHAYILQNHDRRIVFLLPFEGGFTLVGTTEVALAQPPTVMEVSDAEVRYLCDAANRYLRTPINAGDVVWCYAGVRALHDDGKASPTEVTRDYVLQLDYSVSGAPILSVFGGKITTYRRLAEHALEKTFGGAGDSGPPVDRNGATARCCHRALRLRRVSEEHAESLRRVAYRARRRYRTAARIDGNRLDRRRTERQRHGDTFRCWIDGARSGSFYRQGMGRALRKTCCGGAARSACT